MTKYRYDCDDFYDMRYPCVRMLCFDGIVKHEVWLLLLEALENEGDMVIEESASNNMISECFF